MPYLQPKMIVLVEQWLSLSHRQLFWRFFGTKVVAKCVFMSLEHSQSYHNTITPVKRPSNQPSPCHQYQLTVSVRYVDRTVRTCMPPIHYMGTMASPTY